MKLELQPLMMYASFGGLRMETSLGIKKVLGVIHGSTLVYEYDSDEADVTHCGDISHPNNRNKPILIHPSNMTDEQDNIVSQYSSLIFSKMEAINSLVEKPTVYPSVNTNRIIALNGELTQLMLKRTQYYYQEQIDLYGWIDAGIAVEDKKEDKKED